MAISLLVTVMTEDTAVHMMTVVSLMVKMIQGGGDYSRSVSRWQEGNSFVELSSEHVRTTHRCADPYSHGSTHFGCHTSERTRRRSHRSA